MSTRETTSDASCTTPHPSYAMQAETAEQAAGTLKALADPLRLRMLSAISTDPRGESCVCDLAELAEVSQPTVSHHLKVLKETGFVTSERRGSWVWYRVDQDREVAISALMTALEREPTSDPQPLAEEPQSAIGPSHLDGRVTRLAHELASEFSDLDSTLVIALVRESYAGLARTATVTNHLITLTEKFARQRLADVNRDRESRLPQVLFVCVQNAGRSQLAAALVHQLSNGRVIARSAGSSPASQIHPRVRSILERIEDPEQLALAYPKPLTDDAVRAADVVVTMGCGDVCPIIPGVDYEDWAVGDPALASAEGVEAIRQDIEGRVRGLLDRLGVD